MDAQRWPRYNRRCHTLPKYMERHSTRGTASLAAGPRCLHPHLTSCLLHQRDLSMWELCFLRIHDAEDMKRDNNTHFVILLDSVYPDFVNQMLHVQGLTSRISFSMFLQIPGQGAEDSPAPSSPRTRYPNVQHSHSRSRDLCINRWPFPLLLSRLTITTDYIVTD